MPIYEYRCEACAHELELLQKISDSPATTCPECGQESLKKRVSAAGFRLKGGGWYETDFKSGNKKNLAGDNKAKSSKDTKGSGEASKSETKPAKPASSAKAPDK